MAEVQKNVLLQPSNVSKIRRKKSREKEAEFRMFNTINYCTADTHTHTPTLSLALSLGLPFPTYTLCNTKSQGYTTTTANIAGTNIVI